MADFLVELRRLHAEDPAAFASALSESNKGLTEACKAGNLEFINFLIEHGAQVNQIDQVMDETQK